MFDNFIEKGVLSQVAVDDIRQRIAATKNISFDVNVDYIETFKKSDALISDFTSMLIEFFSLKKPIIYCGDTSNFNKVGKEMDKGLYHATNWESLECWLDRLLSGKDELRETYDRVADEISGIGNNIGERICAEVLKDAYRC